MEIHLRETADLVDHYFLVEATRTHRGDKKPILWERLKYEQSKIHYHTSPKKLYCRFTERFSFLREDQVIHVVVDHLGDDVVHKNKAKDGVEW